MHWHGWILDVRFRIDSPWIDRRSLKDCGMLMLLKSSNYDSRIHLESWRALACKRSARDLLVLISAQWTHRKERGEDTLWPTSRLARKASNV